MSTSNRFKLFCIPYAAGSSSVFHNWSDLLLEFIELVPLELAGRGKRFNEDFYPAFKEAIEDLSSQLIGHSAQQPYAIFGHSMGALLAYELAVHMQNMGLQMPKLLFLAGLVPPNRIPVHLNLHQLPDDELWEMLSGLSGYTGIQNDREIRDVYLPIFRADLRVCETYQYYSRREKLGTRFIIMNGDQDEMIRKELRGWAELTEKHCEFTVFRGGHFFIHEDQQSVINKISRSIKEVI